MNNRENPAIASVTWDDVRQEMFTQEEIDASDLRVALIGELIKARNEGRISQKELERLSGVKQPIIARLERGDTMPRIDTLLKILAPMGKTLAVVPIDYKQGANNNVYTR